MDISNNFKQLWIDKKGTIEGMLEVEVLKILRFEQYEKVIIKLHLNDNGKAKLMSWGPYELNEGDQITLTGLKVSIEAKLETN